MKILVIGATGQVACSLRANLPSACYLDRESLDLEALSGIRQRIIDERPGFVINAAAYTAVDKAEVEVERAWRINAHAVREIAAATRDLDVPLLHLSTDYVFSGDATQRYRESDPPDPINQYGASKLQGEREVMQGAGEYWWILRTSWVFGEFGNNFVKTMLRLAESRDELAIVNDQCGRPTYSGDIADVICAIVQRHQRGEAMPRGLYHCASGGAATWFDVARTALEGAHARGLIASVPKLTPILTESYPTPAMRPMCSLLDTTLLESELAWHPKPWRAGVARALDALGRQANGVTSPAAPDRQHPAASPRGDGAHSASVQRLPVAPATGDGRPALKSRRTNFLIFGAPNIDEADIAEVVACLRSGWLGTGPRVERFEANFRDYRRVRHAVAVNSCSAALHLSLLALDLKPGDEVITSPLTFCATVNAIIHAGLTPVLADIDPDTMNIDPDAVRAQLTSSTRAILPVHFAGRPCEMSELCAIASEHGLHMIEDCAHAIEATYAGRPVGTFGDFGCFSFYVTKNITTGEGGMVVTNNDAAQARIKTLALNGMSKDAWNRFGDEGYKHYEVVDSGFKYNMTDLAAALGVRQLERIEPCWERRRDIWERYQQAFALLPVGRPQEPEAYMRHAHHLYTLLIDEQLCGISRDHFMAEMTRREIGVGVHYRSLPEYAYYGERFGWRTADYPHAARVGRSTVSLPLSAKLTDQDVDRVIDAVGEVVGVAHSIRQVH